MNTSTLRQVIFLLLSLISQYSFGQCRLDLTNKYLVYSQTTKVKENFDAPFFYVNKGDTITMVESYFGSRDTVYLVTDTLNPNGTYGIPLREPDESNYPYKAYVKDSIVYFKFYVKGYEQDSILLRKYSLKAGDTCRVDFLNRKRIKGKPITLFYEANSTLNTGIDTTIFLYNNAIDCTKFVEFDTYFTEYSQIVYLEKNSFLPILVHKFYKKELVGSYILRYLVDTDDVKTKEYNYPRY